jgi:hypothetical protein
MIVVKTDRTLRKTRNEWKSRRAVTNLEAKSTIKRQNNAKMESHKGFWAFTESTIILILGKLFWEYICFKTLENWHWHIGQGQ